MLSVLSWSIELREKGLEVKEEDVLDDDDDGVRAGVNILEGLGGSSGAAGRESREGERLCSSWELRPLARAITAYCEESYKSYFNESR